MAFLRKAVLVNGSAIIGIGFSVVQTVILTRVLGPDGIGRYSLVLAALMLTMQLFSFGLPLSYLYHSQHNRQYNRKYLMNVFWLVLFSGLIGGLILAVLMYCKQDYFGSYPFWIYLIVVLHIPIVIQSFLARNDLMIEIQARRLSLMKLSTAIGHVIIVLCFYLTGLLTVNQAILAFFLMTLIRLILGGIWSYKKLDFSIFPDAKTAKDLFLMGIRQSWADLAVLVNGKISLLVIKYVLDDFGQVGYFSRGQRIAMLLVIAGRAVLPLLFSRWAAIAEEKLAENVQRVLRVSFAMVVVMIAGVLIFGKWILIILYGEDFLPALSPMMILMPGTGLYLVSRALMQLLGSRGRPEVSAGVLLVSSILTAILSFILTQIWSIEGAAVAELTGNIVLLTLLLYIVSRIYNIRLSKSLLLTRNDIRIIYKQLRPNKKTNS